MKILYILPFKLDFESCQTGDINMAKSILQRLPKDYEVDVVANFSSIIDSYDLTNQVKDKYNVNNLIDVSQFSDYRDYIRKTFNYLIDNNMFEGYDLIHIHNSTPSIVNKLNTFLNDKKVIFTFHAPCENITFQYYSRDAYIKFLNNKNSMLVCVSKSHMDRCLNALHYYEEYPNGNPNITYILNGIETELKDINDSKLYDCGTIGRFSTTKSMLESLNCVASITKYTGGKGFIIGSTSAYEGTSDYEKIYIEKMMKVLEENPQIDWYKSMSSSDISKLLRNSSCYISLSGIETFGLTVCEALMQGTPCIGFNVNGIGEIIEEGITGYKFNKSRKQWKTRYKEVIDMYEKCLELDSTSVRNRAIERFNINTCVDNYIKLYEDFINKED